MGYLSTWAVPGQVDLSSSPLVVQARAGWGRQEQSDPQAQSRMLEWGWQLLHCSPDTREAKVAFSGSSHLWWVGRVHFTHAMSLATVAAVGRGVCPWGAPCWGQWGFANDSHVSPGGSSLLWWVVTAGGEWQ